MSHVFDCKLIINDLDCLAKGGDSLDMELVHLDKYKWYGRYMGDSPLPEGFTADDLGKCEYVLRLKHNSRAYEVGVVKRKDGKPGYTLLFDFWDRGLGLCDVIGLQGEYLKSAYTEQVVRKQLVTAGLRGIKRTKLDNGQVLLEYVK